MQYILVSAAVAGFGLALLLWLSRRRDFDVLGSIFYMGLFGLVSGYGSWASNNLSYALLSLPFPVLLTVALLIFHGPKNMSTDEILDKLQNRR